MGSMLASARRKHVQPGQALARPGIPRSEYARCDGCWMLPADGRSTVRIVRPDLPYAIGGVTLGVFLLGNAAFAPDAGPLRAIDVALVLAMAAALAVCRRYPVVTLSVVTATMLAFHVRVHAG